MRGLSVDKNIEKDVPSVGLPHAKSKLAYVSYHRTLCALHQNPAKVNVETMLSAQGYSHYHQDPRRENVHM